VDVLEQQLKETERELAELYGDNKVHSITGDLSKKEVCKYASTSKFSQYILRHLQLIILSDKSSTK